MSSGEFVRLPTCPIASGLHQACELTFKTWLTQEPTGPRPRGPWQNFYIFWVEIAIKWKFFFIKAVKIIGTIFSSKILKILECCILTNTDLCVHIMYFNSSKIFKFLGHFRMGDPECTSGEGPTLAHHASRKLFLICLFYMLRKLL